MKTIIPGSGGPRPNLYKIRQEIFDSLPTWENPLRPHYYCEKCGCGMRLESVYDIQLHDSNEVRGFFLWSEYRLCIRFMITCPDCRALQEIKCVSYGEWHANRGSYLS